MSTEVISRAIFKCLGQAGPVFRLDLKKVIIPVLEDMGEV